MSRNILVDVNLNGNELQNVILQNLATAPTGTKAGRLYFNTADNRFHYFNGTSDVVLGDEVQSALAKVATSGKFSDLSGTPTKLSAFTDDLGSSPTHTHSQYLTTHQDLGNYYTKTQTDTAISTAVANAGHIKREIVTALPAVADANEYTIYMILASDGATGDLYDDYMLINGAFEKLGSNRIDLSGYVPNTRKVNGKALSSDVTITADDLGATKKLTATNPALTVSGGVCTWSVSNTLKSVDVVVSVKEVSTGAEVYADITCTTSTITIKINSSSNISAGVYKATIVG
jgi:hypothetical protein